MRLDRVAFGLSVRSWIAVLVLVAAFLVVAGYAGRLGAGVGGLLQLFGLILAAICLLAGSVPPAGSADNG